MDVSGGVTYRWQGCRRLSGVILRMSICASRASRLLIAAAVAWLGLALCAQAAHATYGKVQVAKINQGGDPNDTFAFQPTLVPAAAAFSIKGGQSSSVMQIECNIDRPGKAGECSRWGYPALKVAEQPKAGYKLTDITCRYTQGSTGFGTEPTTSSLVKPASEVTKDLATGTVSLKVHWYEWVKCWYTNTKQPDTGTIKVTKKLLPATDSGKFNLQVDGQTKAANVGDGGTTGVQTVNVGTHTVGETAGTGTSLADYDATTSCVDKAHGGPADTDGSVNVAKGDAWECTITNTRKTPPPPPVPPTPPTPPTPPVTPPAPQIKVSPASVTPGSAKMRGPSGCPTTNVVAATVSGKRIVKVTFYLDGKKVKTLTHANKRGQWILPLNVRRLAYGTHRLQAKVQFAQASGTKVKTMRLSFSRCGGAAAQPQFTG
jgi:hypothetical protein